MSKVVVYITMMLLTRLTRHKTSVTIDTFDNQVGPLPFKEEAQPVTLKVVNVVVRNLGENQTKANAFSARLTN
mgnify:CR=1 FL=1